MLHHGQRTLVVPWAVALCLSLVLFVLPSIAHAAERYWVEDSGAWNTTANWGSASGGASGATVPGVNDIAIFDGNSRGATVTVDTGVDVAGINLANNFTGTVNQGSNSIRVGTSNFLVGSGTFVAGTAAINLAGNFTMTGGIVNGVQDTMTLSGSLSITVGGGNGIPAPTFTSTGTIVFEGAADENFVVGNNTTTTFGNVTASNSGGGSSDNILVNSSGALTLSGELTVTLGNFDLDTFNVALATASGIVIADDAQATFVSDGNVTASGSITTGSTGAFNLSGSTTLTLDGTSQDLDTNNDSIYALTIASSSGATLAANVSVTNALTVNGSSTLTIGSFTLFATGSTVTITNNGAIAENTGKIVHTASSFLIANSSYSEVSGFNVGDTVYFTITDSDENISGTAADTLTITVTATGGDSETVTLTETGNATGIFRGSIVSSVASVSTGDGILESPSGAGTVSASYTDAQDALTNSDDASFNVVASTAGGTSSSGGGGGGGGGGSRRPAAITQYGSSTGMPTARRKTSGEVIGVARTEEPSKAMQEEAAPALPWSDLKLSHPNADAALELHEAGIVKGNDDGTVRLNGFLNRVEALTLLMRTLGAEDVSTQRLPFSDVQQNAWYAPSVRAAVAMGLLKGFPDGTLRPAAELNLVQSLKLISIALGLAEQEQETRAARWFDPYVTAAKQAGLVSGTVAEGRGVRRGEFFSWLTTVLRQHGAAE